MNRSANNLCKDQSLQFQVDSLRLPRQAPHVNQEQENLVRPFFRVAFLLLFAVTAKADSFDFTFTGDNFSASGTLTGDLQSPGIYHLYQIAGTVTDFGAYPTIDILGLYPNGEINGADNLLFTTPPYVDSFGINFALTDGSSLALAHDSFGYFMTGCYQGSCSPNNHVFSRGDLVVASTVPEPSTLLLFTTGLSACSLPLRRYLRR